MRKIKAIILTLALALCFACKTGKVTVPGQPNGLTPDDVLRDAKSVGAVVAVALDEGIALEQTLATNGTLDPVVEPKIREYLRRAKIAAVDFNTRVARYDHLDTDSKKLIAGFLEEALGFIQTINNEGVLQIKNEQSKLIAAGIISGARLALTVYKLTFDRVQ